MHVAPKGRERAFRILSELLGPSGLLVITLRLGGDSAENAARGFHGTSAEELIGYPFVVRDAGTTGVDVCGVSGQRQPSVAHDA